MNKIKLLLKIAFGSAKASIITGIATVTVVGGITTAGIVTYNSVYAGHNKAVVQAKVYKDNVKNTANVTEKEADKTLEDTNKDNTIGNNTVVADNSQDKQTQSSTVDNKAGSQGSTSTTSNSTNTSNESKTNSSNTNNTETNTQMPSTVTPTPAPQPQPQPQPQPAPTPAPQPVNAFLYDADMTAKWMAKYRDDNYTARSSFNGKKYYDSTGVAYSKLMNVLHAYGQDKITLQDMEPLNVVINGYRYICDNNPYDLTHKIWFEPSVNMWSNMNAHFISAQKVIINTGDLDTMYSEAKANGLYNYSSMYMYDGEFPFKEIAVYTNPATNQTKVARLCIGIGNTVRDVPPEDKEPGYNWPY